MKAIKDRLVVQRLEEPTSNSPIIIPDAAKEVSCRGRVVTAGAGHLTENGDTVGLEVKTGDVILFGKYAGMEVKIDGTDYVIMREDDVLVVLDAEPATIKH